MYVHLQQIDEGPNYRWGRAGNGGNGVIIITLMESGTASMDLKM